MKNKQLLPSIDFKDPIRDEYGKAGINNTEIPNFVRNNLNAKFKLRPYQEEALQRFIVSYEEQLIPQNQLIHWLYHMATGSGKTLVMAGLILYLYEKGYRNFLFLVNSTNIIEKTKANFLDRTSSKYLFRKEQININGRVITIKEVNNFEKHVSSDIQIKFTTIQKLHSELNTPRENGVSFEDFQEQQIVFLADEAHHLQAATKKVQASIEGGWEETVEKCFKQNSGNILLEFTATIGDKDASIIEKYQRKRAFTYNLRLFCRNRYSKDIFLLRSDFNQTERILQAIIINLYRQKIAFKNNINLKPVILFKAKRTICESNQNADNFRQLIDNLTVKQIENLFRLSQVAITQKAAQFFRDEKMTSQDIVKALQDNFKAENCLNVNEEKELEKNQIQLNTLEDLDNPIRAIFAVKKLNEGWDVLNLFDIVRLYESRDSGKKVIGPTTISEAQLIGRGARYFPFSFDDEADKYQRKFDRNLNHELRILEQLHYHAKEDHRYISELKQALEDEGLIEPRQVKKLTVKDEFLEEDKRTAESDFYHEGEVFANKKVKRDYAKQPISTNELQESISINLSAGAGILDPVFKGEVLSEHEDDATRTTYRVNAVQTLKTIPKHIVRYSLSKEPFFYFDHLQAIFPDLKTLSEFVDNDQYLGATPIDVRSSNKQPDLNNDDYLFIADQALKQVQSRIEQDIKYDYMGEGKFTAKKIREVFTKKDLFVKDGKRNESEEQLERELQNAPWYIFNEYYGTDQEIAFVKTFQELLLPSLSENYKDIYLVRNELHIKIYDRQGVGFAPDFLLFCRRADGQEVRCQVFIEPKGQHLADNKEEVQKKEFLQAIYNQEYEIDYQEGRINQSNKQEHKVTAVPLFYNAGNDPNKKSESEKMAHIAPFIEKFKEALDIQI